MPARNKQGGRLRSMNARRLLARINNDIETLENRAMQDARFSHLVAGCAGIREAISKALLGFGNFNEGGHHAETDK